MLPSLFFTEPPYGLQRGGNAHAVEHHLASRRLLRSLTDDDLDAVETDPPESPDDKQPGGDGNGNLLERIQAAVHGMSRTTRFQSEATCKLYGVILNEQTLEVDEAAAKTLRMEMRSYPWIPIWSCHPIQTSQVVALKGGRGSAQQSEPFGAAALSEAGS